MELIEQDGADPVERWIVLDEAGKDALCNDLDAGPLRDHGAETNPVADGVADFLAERLRHAGGGRARGEPARLQNQDFLIGRPRLIRQDQRNPRRLARTRRGNQHGRRAPRQRGHEVRRSGIDG